MVVFSMHKAVIIDFSRTLYDPHTGHLIDNALELLKTLQYKGYTMVLVSRTSDLSHDHLAHLGISHFFTSVIVSPTKNEELFRRVAEQLDVDPVHTLVIGDKAHSEIAVGKKAGMKTIWFKHG